jgi:lipid-A-disaccharide synthase-like uncharacterized protein
MEDLGKMILGIIFWLYSIISQIMTVVYFIEYCRTDDSLLKIILLDPILSEIKGILWIIFIWL